ncbi:MAG: potassium-transporting ATPase subunit KdpA [Clostridia bacterium]
MMNALMQYTLYLVLLVGLSWPLGRYIANVMDGKKVFLSRVLRPCESGLYKLMRISEAEEMSWKKYALCAVMFNAIGLALLWGMQALQGLLPFNPEGLPGVRWDLGFNTAVSFMTNTNWQAYSGEATLSYLTQMVGLTVQNFVSAATGIAVLFALIRGLRRVREHGLGSFWTDMVRSTVYVLLPLALVLALAQTSQGVIQNMSGHIEYQLMEPVSATLQDGATAQVTKGYLPMGPASSQIAIKQLGTNGGGYNGTNSAHPLENPTPLSNLLEMLALLLIPVALCFTFGHAVKDTRQGRALLLAMFVLLVVAMGCCALAEHAGTPQLAQNGAVSSSANMEGKETRFGIPTSVTWAAWTTAASNGSVNSMHDSYTPLGGMMPMLLIQLGEVVFGGVGCGLYGMLGFVMLTVFIAGLMVGHTPEYLGKKIEAREMRLAVMVCLATPVACLIGAGIACMVPATADSLHNAGAHGFSEVLYAYSSAAGNNGSAFAGFNANTPFLNVSLGLVMLFARFVPMLATLGIAGSMVEKKRIAVSAGTLSTSNGMFVFLLIFIVLLIGALSFFPALALGPIAEYFQMFS